MKHLVLLIILAAAALASDYSSQLWVTDNPKCWELPLGYRTTNGTKVEDCELSKVSGKCFTHMLYEEESVTFCYDQPNGILFNWSATIPIETIIMKGGNGANLYHYPDGTMSSTEPIYTKWPDGITHVAPRPALSHVDFCWSLRLVVRGYARGVHHRKYEFTLDASPVPPCENATLGDPTVLRLDYAVGFKTNSEGWNVQGRFFIYNPADVPVSLACKPTARLGDSIELDVSCNPPHTQPIPAGCLMTCYFNRSECGAVPALPSIVYVDVTTAEGSPVKGICNLKIPFEWEYEACPTVALLKLVLRPADGMIIRDQFDNVRILIQRQPEGEYPDCGSFNGSAYATVVFLRCGRFRLIADADLVDLFGNLLASKDVEFCRKVRCKDLEIEPCPEARGVHRRKYEWSVEACAVPPTCENATLGEPTDLNVSYVVSFKTESEGWFIEGSFVIHNPGDLPVTLACVPTALLDDVKPLDVFCGPPGQPLIILPGCKLKCSFNKSEDGPVPDLKPIIHIHVTTEDGLKVEGLVCFNWVYEVCPIKALLKLVLRPLEGMKIIDGFDSAILVIEPLSCGQYPACGSFEGSSKFIVVFSLCGEYHPIVDVYLLALGRVVDSAVVVFCKKVPCVPPGGPGGPGGRCTYTIGYWKNHDWPACVSFVPECPDDSFFNTQMTWLAILKLPPGQPMKLQTTRGSRCGAYCILAHQYIGAILNLINMEQQGFMTSDLVDVKNAIADATALFNAADPVAKTFTSPEMLSLAALLDLFNEGTLEQTGGVVIPHCD